MPLSGNSFPSTVIVSVKLKACSQKNDILTRASFRYLSAGKLAPFFYWFHSREKRGKLVWFCFVASSVQLCYLCVLDLNFNWKKISFFHFQSKLNEASKSFFKFWSCSVSFSLHSSFFRYNLIIIKQWMSDVSNQEKLKPESAQKTVLWLIRCRTYKTRKLRLDKGPQAH